MGTQQAVAAALDQLTADRLESTVLACVRIARLNNDHLSAASFQRELFPDKSEVGRTLLEDMTGLNEEAQKFIFDTSFHRWLEIHTIDYLDDADDKSVGDRRNVLKIAAGEIDAELQAWESALADLVPPQNNAYDADRILREKAQIRVRVRALNTIRSRLKTRCLNFLVQMERQAEQQKRSRLFLERVQGEVNNYFRAHSPEVLAKLEKATELVDIGAAEDRALSLTSVRRALKAAADYFYPPAGKVVCADGVERELGDDQYLNRLQEYISQTFGRSTSGDLIRAEAEYLCAYSRRLNTLASKGVHSDVDVEEARQGLVGLYFFLFNVTQRQSAS